MSHRGGRGDDEPIRRLLLDAVPELRAPEDRLGRVAELVGRRRRARWASATSAMAVLVLLAGVAFLARSPAGIPPAQGSPHPSESTVSTPSPSAPPSSPAPSVIGTALPPVATVPPPGIPYVASSIPAGSAGTNLERVTRTGAMPAANGVGSFRHVCRYSHMAPDDPVAAPGQPGRAPLMVFAGNTAAGANSTAASIASSGNSTCWGGTADRSAYWAPAVIDVRSGTPVAPTEFSLRFSANTADATQIRSMPAGLRLLADQASWGCWDGTATTHDRPTACPAGKQLVLNVWFPRCWDGSRLDSTDHHAHLAYPPDGRCPASHPVQLPQLEYHVLYSAPVDGNLGAWRLSNDTAPADPSTAGGPIIGYGGYFEGWSAGIRQAWTDGCVRKPATCDERILGDGRVLGNP